MKNSLISIIGLSLVSLIGCNPDFETLTEQTTEIIETNSDNSLGHSQTSNVDSSEIITTSGITSLSDLPLGDGSSSNTSDNSTTSSDEVICGNGILEFIEECDDGNLVNEDDCSNNCFKPRFAFLTNTSLPSNFGGIILADEICQREALQADLTGKFKAWISENTFESAPKVRFESENFFGWYQLPSNPPILIAEGWKELVSEELANSISTNAFGSEMNIPEFVWSGTFHDGSFIEDNNCNNWTSDNGSDVAIIGSNESTTQWCDLQQEICTKNINKKLYCFQVE
jgi:cysteine-rich repeat protein